MPLSDVKRLSCINVPSEFQQIIFIQVILEEGEDSFQRITCFAGF